MECQTIHRISCQSESAQSFIGRQGPISPRGIRRGVSSPLNDALAALARIGEGPRVANFGAGLSDPARYLAHRYGTDVTRIELTPASE